mgnify:CR=1 FL=1
MDHQSEIKNKGFIEIANDKNIDYKKEINRLRKEKNAIILAHFYQVGEIQDIADFVGDSLALARKAAKTDADIIVFAGVHFMAETAKILSPEKKVLIPDLNAGCSLADSCPAEEFRKFVDKYPDHIVISYVNTTAAIKTMTDIVCTSSNAIQIINYIDEDQKIIFAPDKNLGNYLVNKTGRDMKIWQGACHVHDEISLEGILEIKKKHPEAKIIAHPECQKPVLLVSEFIGSTSQLLKFIQTDNSQEYIVATDTGIIHQMKNKAPAKTYYPAPSINSTCGCSDCNFMKLISLPKIYTALEYEMPEINVPEHVRKHAVKPINKMLEISDKLKI